MEQVTDINAGGSDDPKSLIVYDQKLYFRAVNSSGNMKLYRTYESGGNIEVEQVTNNNSGGNDFKEVVSIIYKIYDGKLYFRGYNSSSQYKVFRTYEDSGGNVQVEQITDTDPDGQDYPSNPVVYQNKMYWELSNDSGNGKMYRIYEGSGGSVQVEKVSNTNPGGDDGISHSTVYDGKLYFLAYNDSSHEKLYRTYESEMGELRVEQLTDINPGGDDYPAPKLIYNDKLYFTGFTGVGSQWFDLNLYTIEEN